MADSSSPKKSQTHGAGSLKLKSGTEDVWRLRVSVVGDDSVRYRTVERTFRGTEPQARRELSRFFTEQDAKKLRRDKTTLAQLIDEVIENKRRRGRAPKTLDEYERMGEWLKEQYGKTDVSRVGPKWIDDVCDRVMDEKGQSSASHYWTFLRMLFRFAVRRGLLDHSPTDRTDPIPEPEPKTRTPTPEEVRALIRAAVDSDFAAAIFIAATRALGPAELAGLRVEDVDLERGQIAVRSSISRIAGVKHVKEPKTKARVAPVALDEASAAVMAAQIARVAESCRACDVPLTADRYIWSLEADHSEPVAPDYFSTRFRWARDATEIQGIRFYDLRHYAATQAIAHGVDIKTTQSLMRHSTSHMTLDRYASIVQAQGIEAARILTATLAEPESSQSLSQLLPQ